VSIFAISFAFHNSFFFFFFLQGVKMVILLFYFLFSKKSFLFEYEGFVFRNVQFGQTQHGF